MDIKKIVNFIFEINQLKKQKTSGWRLIGVDVPPSNADHTLRAAQIGYILAAMEGNPNPERVTTILVVHENGEARIGDQNKVSAKYYNKSEGENQAFRDQSNNLGEEIEKKWNIYFEEFENRNTPEGVIAKDADWLETAFQAKEYLDLGHKDAQNWIDNVEKSLETESAKKLLEEMKNTKFTEWWKDLKKMTYTKLEK
ncbi:MAG: HD domain-containing protein [Candidatus Moranbacteria bacterium]|nr:HD domain-containing protein [Candidatus Moranbacteria bacterium]